MAIPVEDTREVAADGIVGFVHGSVVPLGVHESTTSRSGRYWCQMEQPVFIDFNVAPCSYIVKQ